ncbi:MAG: hypothetical protein AAB268_07115 [Elusimicrobiota bacterium]
MRRFLFIDASGDEGLVSVGGSTHYVVGAVELAERPLDESRRLLSAIRHLMELHREMKASGLTPGNRPRVKSCVALCEMIEQGHAYASVVVVNKSTYVGPYLGHKFRPKPDYFRNYTIRRLLERHLAKWPLAASDSLELVFDRFTMTGATLTNLEVYLAGNWGLPPLEAIVHADSRYVDPLFWPDLLVTVVKEAVTGTPGTGDQARLCALVPTHALLR